MVQGLLKRSEYLAGKVLPRCGFAWVVLMKDWAYWSVQMMTQKFAPRVSPDTQLET